MADNPALDKENQYPRTGSWRTKYHQNAAFEIKKLNALLKKIRTSKRKIKRKQGDEQIYAFQLQTAVEVEEHLQQFRANAPPEVLEALKNRCSCGNGHTSNDGDQFDNVDSKIEAKEVKYTFVKNNKDVPSAAPEEEHDSNRNNFKSKKTSAKENKKSRNNVQQQTERSSKEKNKIKYPPADGSFPLVEFPADGGFPPMEFIKNCNFVVSVGKPSNEEIKNSNLQQSAGRPDPPRVTASCSTSTALDSVDTNDDEKNVNKVPAPETSAKEENINNVQRPSNVKPGTSGATVTCSTSTVPETRDAWTNTYPPSLEAPPTNRGRSLASAPAKERTPTPFPGKSVPKENILNKPKVTSPADAAKFLASSVPDANRGTSQAPNENPGTSQAPKENPGTSQTPNANPVTSQASAQNPVASRAPIEKPVTAQAPVVKPVTSQAQTDKPVTSQLPAVKPVIPSAPAVKRTVPPCPFHTGTSAGPKPPAKPRCRASATTPVASRAASRSPTPISEAARLLDGDITFLPCPICVEPRVPPLPNQCYAFCQAHSGNVQSGKKCCAKKGKNPGRPFPKKGGRK